MYGLSRVGVAANRDPLPTRAPLLAAHHRDDAIAYATPILSVDGEVMGSGQPSGPSAPAARLGVHAHVRFHAEMPNVGAKEVQVLKASL